MKNPSRPPPFLAIAVLSAAALAYEVLLTRLFAIIQWHHFAFMVISLALLGYGASGTFLVLFGETLKRHFHLAFSANATLFGVSAVVCFRLAQQVPFNPLAMAWDWHQLGYLCAVYLLLAVPFLAVANCIGLVLWHYPAHLHRAYAFDLAGAGAGAIGVILLLFIQHPHEVLTLLGLLGLTGGMLGCREGKAKIRCWALPAIGLALLLLQLPGDGPQLQLSQYKGLSQALRASDARIVKEIHGPLGLISVVDNPTVPLRYAPGLSLTSEHTPPHQLGLYLDGNLAGALARFEGDWGKLAYLDQLTSALPYHLRPNPFTLILGAGGGSSILQALYLQAPAVHAVELNPQLLELARQDFAAFAGNLYALPQVRVEVGEARGFLSANEQTYDLIELPPADASGSAATGLHGLSESYLYTLEAFQLYLRHLNPDGMLAVTSYLQLPPRGSLKLLATAADALRREGNQHPGRHLAMIRGWNTVTLIVKQAPLAPSEIAELKHFAKSRGFDPVYFPEIRLGDTNHHHKSPEPFLFQGAQAILGPERTEFLEHYKFDLRPATDDRPYFLHFFRWHTLPELLSLQAGGGLAQLEWGYLTLVATLLQAALASVLLILLPLYLGRQGRTLRAASPSVRWRTLGYFAALGLAFLFLEMAFIQKFTLFLSHPLYAIAVVLAAFLMFAGIGSAWSRRLVSAGGGQVSGERLIFRAVLAISVLSLGFVHLLPILFERLMYLPDPAKILLAAISIAPLAFAMGLPFPVGMARLSTTAPELIPWAWAINGCASVISAVLATLLAIAFGFTTVVLLAVVLYLAATKFIPCE